MDGMQRQGGRPGEPAAAGRRVCAALWRRIAGTVTRLAMMVWRLAGGLPPAAPALPSFFEQAVQARRDLLWAQNCFNSVTDARLLDYAMYQMLAAESKYSYFLGKLRAGG